jgi:hypothetical protein
MLSVAFFIVMLNVIILNVVAPPSTVSHHPLNHNNEGRYYKHFYNRNFGLRAVS